MILSGHEVQKELEKKILKEVKNIGDLKFVVIYIGDNKASQKYINNKIKFATRFNIKHELKSFEEDVEQKDIENLIDELNEDSSVHGIFLQLPVPGNLNEFELTQRICWQKDIDGFNAFNIGKTYYNKESLISCTAKGIIAILEYYEIEVVGKTVCIAGRSNLVGKILSLMFINLGATTIVCNSKTKDIKKHINNSDIFVSAIGRGKFFTKDYFENENLTVVDVGINFLDGKMVGDVDFENVDKLVKNITPVPGGVGVLTVTEVILNLIQAKKIQNKIK